MYFIFRHKVTDEKRLGAVFWPERQIALTVTRDHCSRCVHIERNDPKYACIQTRVFFRERPVHTHGTTVHHEIVQLVTVIGAE